MRERRAAHVRPLPPSGDRLRTHQIRASAPASNLVRRYRPVRTSKGVPAPIGIGVIALFLVMGVAMLIVGGNILVSVVGQVAQAFDGAISKVSSQAPATVAPSGVALDTPVLDAPSNGGYTNQPTISLSGSVPAAAVGKTGYSVRVYAIASSGTRSQVALVNVGATAHFSTPAVPLAEGTNTFAAALVTPSVEGQPSPEVVYILDTKLPTLSVASQPDNNSQTGGSVVITGTTDPGVTVTVLNRRAPGSGGQSSEIVGPDGRFALTVGVVAGSNPILVTAQDQAGNVSTGTVTVNRSLGKLAATLSVKPSRFRGKGPTTLTLTVHATSVNGGPLAGASVTFQVNAPGLGPLQGTSTTNQSGVATWNVTISGATAGVGSATAYITTSNGDPIQKQVPFTTT
jgi:hypothetical protein